jgi:hypothetical protein
MSYPVWDTKGKKSTSNSTQKGQYLVDYHSHKHCLPAPYKFSQSNYHPPYHWHSVQLTKMLITPYLQNLQTEKTDPNSHTRKATLCPIFHPHTSLLALLQLELPNTFHFIWATFILDCQVCFGDFLVHQNGSCSIVLVFPFHYKQK